MTITLRYIQCVRFKDLSTLFRNIRHGYEWNSSCTYIKRNSVAYNGYCAINATWKKASLKHTITESTQKTLRTSGRYQWPGIHKYATTDASEQFLDCTIQTSTPTLISNEKEGTTKLLAFSVCHSKPLSHTQPTSRRMRVLQQTIYFPVLLDTTISFCTSKQN